MTGFPAGSEYDNATLENFILALGGNIGLRVVGAKFQWDSTNSEVDVTNIMGGMSPYCNRTATGLYTITYETSFRNIAAPLKSTAANYQVHLYDATISGCKVMLLNANTMALTDDVAFFVGCFGR